MPLLATAVLIGLSQLTAPAVSFMNDMRPHTPGLRHSPLVPSIIFLVCTVGLVWVLYPEGFGGDLLSLRSLPFRFQVELLIYLAASALILSILLNMLRRVIVRRQASRLSVASYVPLSTDRPEGANRPVSRKCFDGHDAVLRSTASTDAGDWLRRTASAVGDMSSILPGHRSNKIAHEVPV